MFLLYRFFVVCGWCDNSAVGWKFRLKFPTNNFAAASFNCDGRTPPRGRLLLPPPPPGGHLNLKLYNYVDKTALLANILAIPDKMPHNQRGVNESIPP